MSRTLSWALLVVWCAWLFAVQGYFASSVLGRWTPDLGLVLLLSLDRRLDRADALLAIAIVSCARIGFTADPPLMIVVGYSAVVVVMRRMRRVAEIDHVVSKSLVGALAAAALTVYWTLGRDVALAADPDLFAAPATDPLAGVRALDPREVALASAVTGLAVVLLGPLVVRLPGITPLRAGARGGRR